MAKPWRIFDLQIKDKWSSQSLFFESGTHLDLHVSFDPIQVLLVFTERSSHCPQFSYSPRVLRFLTNVDFTYYLKVMLSVGIPYMCRSGSEAQWTLWETAAAMNMKYNLVVAYSHLVWFFSLSCTKFRWLCLWANVLLLRTWDEVCN